ncbi:hypothetical protein [Mariniradius sediminis]|uniref:DUF2243 domain-containing protein n=1 Tax=Mariniradius sediminis TaxID=2909237 RepID=A0ABS9BXD6_9BACT|nr:hypothetical protein [Mariniradius sediminis]MCF1752369.1 hypothetical protein [Mariniradius sediminis]
MLKLGGYLNILFAILHIVGLIWAEKMFELVGIAEGMALAKQDIHPLYPYFITVVVGIIFFIMGLYGLSADNKFKKLPLLKPMVFCIGGIYFLRGIGELIFDIGWQKASPLLENTYSLIAVFVGLLYLVGGLKKWKIKETK